MRNNKNNITSGLENIISFLGNIIPHFTGKEKIITLSLVIIMLSLVNITLCFPNIFDSNNVSALSYSTNVNIGFTFNPTISLSISPDNLTISNLTPGTALDSNTITINVATNTAYGYQLTANVGDNTTNYNTTSLVHASSATSTPTSNATFTSLAYGASIASKDNLPTNTWGYSYSKDNGTTWQSYSGLPLYSDTEHSAELISTYNPANSKSIDFKIAANSSNTQPSGEYTNIINFYAVSNPEPPTLYDTVRYMTKGTLAENNVKLSDTITQANSGVYTYDPAIYGAASDASNDYSIYFYRGILDTDAGLGTYGSDGQADAWPNYVKLSNNTCWRIVRTTGSGGVKMIYNGTNKNGTCANATTNARVATKAFNNVSTRSYGIVAVGYTFNSSFLTTSADTVYGVLFGTNSNYIGNSVDSTVKDYLENTWFTSIMSSYESKLETSAGYCSDRSIYVSGRLMEDNELVSTPYNTAPSGVTSYRFGASQRNLFTAGPPSFTCLRQADLYTVNGAIDGNGQLFKPTALLTADETSLAGTGYGATNRPSYNDKSFLNSGDTSLLLSPSFRDTNSYAYGYRINANGSMNGASGLGGIHDVRPVISLMHHIQVTGGTGTSTSPWTIE